MSAVRYEKDTLKGVSSDCILLINICKKIIQNMTINKNIIMKPTLQEKISHERSNILPSSSSGGYEDISCGHV
jgi:hypothetical protein